VDMCPV